MDVLYFCIVFCVFRVLEALIQCSETKQLLHKGRRRRRRQPAAGSQQPAPAGADAVDIAATASASWGQCADMY
jgi:hypothetical protein